MVVELAKGLTKMNECCINTDKHLWRKIEEDYYSPSIHVTEDGNIGINVGGHVIIKSIEEWFKLGNNGEALK